MNLSLMTLSDFQAVQLPPQTARAPRTMLPTLLKVTFGLLIASPATTSRMHGQQTSGAQDQSLDSQPLIVPDERQNRLEKLTEALSDALQLSDTLVASDEGDPVDQQTLTYAIQSIAALMVSLEVSIPLILPLQNGGIGVEWHRSGMNIELRFRKPYDVYAVLEDARSVIDPFHGHDPELVNARFALSELSTRSVE
jgi:hypothetical protein